MSVSKKEVSGSAFAYLYSASIDYFKKRSRSQPAVSNRLEQMGYNIGHRVLELLAFREKESGRAIRLMPMMQFIANDVWKYLFGKQATLMKYPNEISPYGICDQDPLTNTFISVPNDWRNFESAVFIGGIVKGILCAASFPCTIKCRKPRENTVEFVPAFENTVIEREKLKNRPNSDLI